MRSLELVVALGFDQLEHHSWHFRAVLLHSLCGVLLPRILVRTHNLLFCFAHCDVFCALDATPNQLDGIQIRTVRRMLEVLHLVLLEELNLKP